MPPEWSEIRAQLGPALERVVASYAPPGPDREDLAQQVALEVIGALPRFRGEASIKTYVLRIAHNVGLRGALKRRRYRSEPLTEIADRRRSPEEQVAGRRDRDRLLRAVRQVPIAQRQVLTLALEELSHREIADVLQISENAVAIRLHRARKTLKTLLEDP